MKRIVMACLMPLFGLLALSLPTAAQPPVRINYQGRLVDGTDLVNGTVTLFFNLYDASVGGNLLYAEKQNGVVVVDGLYSVRIGDGETDDDLLVALQEPQVWLELVVGTTTLTPRERLVSVPYALYARDAGNLNGEAAEAFMRRTGPESLTANSTTTAALTVQQTGTRDGLEASTLSTVAGRAAVKGVAGSASSSVTSPAGVFGTSASHRGVVGTSTSSDGVLGFSTSGFGVHGQSSSGTGVRGFSSSGLAIEAIGDASVAGDLTVTGSIQNSMMPIAMASISTAATLWSSSGNVSVVWNSTRSRYEITIAGENYWWPNYVTVVTPSSEGVIFREGSIDNRLLVWFTDLSGNPVQSHFQFITYKP